METITTWLRKDKNGLSYFYQQVEMGAKGHKGHEILWSGKVSISEWDHWHQIAKEQPDRLVGQTEGVYITVKN